MTPLGRWSMLVVISTAIALASPTPALTPTEQLNTLLVMNGTTLIANTSATTFSSLINAIIQCESGGKHDVWGKAGEYGCAQFKSETFYWLAEKANIEYPDWKDEAQQIYLLGWALDHGYQNHWTCYKKVYEKTM